ncbi:MAG: serine/threonine protein kinase [Solirubrobacterales bacterium]|nr:serine/threonine protein kinase [Solirubrobacterales bacterium]
MTETVVGSVFAGCRVEQVIGRGGMGVVYRGRDITLERLVAIKLIAADRAADESARHRFEREARLMASIDHPNVIPVYAAGEQQGHLFIVMRYVGGTDLQRRLHEQGPLEPIEAARITDQIAQALDAAHARGLVHRDIKPANVLLNEGHAYLTDFGITRLTDEVSHTTESGDWVGTVEFMSPEHLRGEATEAQSDIYSLGCVLHACLTGTPPLKRDSPAATIAAQLNERAPAPSLSAGVPRRFDQVVGRALAKDPRHRYRSAGDLAADALEAAAGKPQRWSAKRAAAAKPAESASKSEEALTRLSSSDPKTHVLPPSASRAEPQRTSQMDVDADYRRLLDSERKARRKPAPAPVEPVTVDAKTQEFSALEPKTQQMDALEPKTQQLSVAPAEPASEQRPREGGKTPRRALAVVGLGVLALVVALVLVLALQGPKRRVLRPLGVGEVNRVLNRFASDFSHHNTAAMAKLLAPHVTRVNTVSSEHGAKQVLADYRHQFRTNPPVSYRLSGMVVTPGWLGRASGDYTLKLKDGSTLTGSVTFGLQRVGDRALIGLIATQQNG